MLDMVQLVDDIQTVHAKFERSDLRGTEDEENFRRVLGQRFTE